MPIIESKGAVSSQGFGEFAKSGVANYIEDVFSTYLYTGNGSTQTITNGIDLAGKGGLYWWKVRNIADSNYLVDTTRGATKWLVSNSTGAEQTVTTSGLALNSNGVSFNNNWQEMNLSGNTYASWTFRKQPKFFDVVTFTYTGSSQLVSHSLGSAPGAVIMKRTDASEDWCGWFYGSGTTGYTMSLNTTQPSTTTVNSSNFTSTTFKPGVTYGSNAGGTVVPTVGGTYVAYLFANNAGGFGLTGTDNVISCGSYTGTGSAGNAVTLGYEPQWLLIKRTDTSGFNWIMEDTMRNMSLGGDAVLYANLSNAEADTSPTAHAYPTATGFVLGSTATSWNASGGTYIYIAIRRGPMKVPTDGTKVFNAAITSNDTVAVTTGFPVDMYMEPLRSGDAYNTVTCDRLRSNAIILSTSSTAAEINVGSGSSGFANNTGLATGIRGSGSAVSLWSFGRAPGFFDEVCYTGTGADQTLTHNLGVSPELIIFKKRSATQNWNVLSSQIPTDKRLILNTTGGLDNAGTTIWNVTSTTFVAYQSAVGLSASGATYVAYLFASCPGVSKVFSMTGNGTTQTVNCGFTAGARFVLLKRTDSTGNWMVFDTARGMTTSTDPWLALNLTSAESATTGACTTTSVGFTVDESKLTGINTNAATYIGIAIA